MELIGVRVDMPSNTPVLLLQEQEGDRQGGEEGQAEPAHGRHGDIAAQHSERAVGKIDEVHQPERNGEAHGQDEQQHPEGEPVEQDDGKLADHDPPLDPVRATSLRAADPSRSGFRG
jgi:hypothetical protein